MKTIPAVVAALAFGVTGARAATIYTPPVLHEGSSTSFCNVANVSSQAREITVTIFDDDGTAVLGPRRST